MGFVGFDSLVFYKNNFIRTTSLSKILLVLIKNKRGKAYITHVCPLHNLPTKPTYSLNSLGSA